MEMDCPERMVDECLFFIDETRKGYEGCRGKNSHVAFSPWEFLPLGLGLPGPVLDEVARGVEHGLPRRPRAPAEQPMCAG